MKNEALKILASAEKRSSQGKGKQKRIARRFLDAIKGEDENELEDAMRDLVEECMYEDED
jgi:F0F1-type ATP synthase membrane subunit b/b'